MVPSPSKPLGYRRQDAPEAAAAAGGGAQVLATQPPPAGGGATLFGTSSSRRLPTIQFCILIPPFSCCSGLVFAKDIVYKAYVYIYLFSLIPSSKLESKCNLKIFF